MSVSLSWPAGQSRVARLTQAFSTVALPTAMLLLGATLLVALETPSKPFLEKNSFYLSSAGFRIQLANDAEGKKALKALPPHRFVVHTLPNGDTRYVYAEPQHCVCVFIGNGAAYDNYRAMLANAPTQVDNVAPDYRSQSNVLLASDPVGLNTVGDAFDAVVGVFHLNE